MRVKTCIRAQPPADDGETTTEDAPCHQQKTAYDVGWKTISSLSYRYRGLQEQNKVLGPRRWMANAQRSSVTSEEILGGEGYRAEI